MWQKYATLDLILQKQVREFVILTSGTYQLIITTHYLYIVHLIQRFMVQQTLWYLMIPTYRHGYFESLVPQLGYIPKGIGMTKICHSGPFSQFVFCFQRSFNFEMIPASVGPLRKMCAVPRRLLWMELGFQTSRLMFASTMAKDFILYTYDFIRTQKN